MTFWAGFAWGALTVVAIVACYAWAAVVAAEPFEDGAHPAPTLDDLYAAEKDAFQRMKASDFDHAAVDDWRKAKDALFQGLRREGRMTAPMRFEGLEGER